MYKKKGYNFLKIIVGGFHSLNPQLAGIVHTGFQLTKVKQSRPARFLDRSTLTVDSVFAIVLEASGDLEPNSGRCASLSRSVDHPRYSSSSGVSIGRFCLL